MILQYDFFKNSLNDRLFKDGYKDLLEKIATSPDRYIGLFRPTKPKTKLIQNITQSHEIKFGDALEFLFEQYFNALGFEPKPKRFVTFSNKELSIDQLFAKGNILYMIEQKVRDDHDSTKKVGQFQNFEDKYQELTLNYPEFEIIPIMWFIDDSLAKNRRYYTSEMEKMGMDYGCTPMLFYGGEMFDTNGGIEDFPIAMWDETLEYLKRWKDALPDMPEVNLDLSADRVFEEIKDITPSVYRKLLGNEDVVKQIFPILFPDKIVLGKLSNYFKTNETKIYKTLHSLVEQAMAKYKI